MQIIFKKNANPLSKASGQGKIFLTANFTLPGSQIFKKKKPKSEFWYCRLFMFICQTYKILHFHHPEIFGLMYRGMPSPAPSTQAEKVAVFYDICRNLHTY